MKELFLIFLIIFMISMGGLFPDSPFSLTFTAGADLPLINTDIFSTGGGAGAAGSFRLPGISFLRPLGHLDYFLTPVSDLEENMSVISLGAGADTVIPLNRIMDFRGALSGGYGIFLYPGKDPNSSPFVKAELQMLFNLTSSFQLGLGAGYRHYFNGLYSGVTGGLGTVIALGGGRGPRMEFESIQFDPVFPVLFKYYDTSPLGILKLKNDEKGPVENVRVTLFVKNYMDSPRESEIVRRMEKDAVLDIPLYALFNDSVLDITEGTKVQAEVTVEYDYLNDRQTKSVSRTLQLYDRNAATWDDDRKAAAFITAKDPNVLAFSKNFGGLARDSGASAVDSALSMAMGIFEALGLYGVNYVRDPGSAYDVLSEDEMAVDYLQFPYQTLQYRAGDCDDLSILYCSLLEAASIETAFVTVPGHIYMAFALKMDPGEIRKILNNPDSVIYREEKAWVPVEITMVGQGFLKAWDTGLNEWKKYEDQAGFFPVHSAWGIYEPVGFASRSSDLELPGRNEFLEEYSRELETFISRQIYSRVEELEARLEQSRNKAGVYNRLGVLYARFGLYEKAEESFREGADLGNLSSKVNLGNIYFLMEMYEDARTAFRDVLSEHSGSAVALIGLARADYELGNYSGAEDSYNRAVALKPEWAEVYSYLASTSSSGARASDQTDKFLMYWEE